MNYAPNLRLTGHNNTNLTRTIQNWKILDHMQPWKYQEESKSTHCCHVKSGQASSKTYTLMVANLSCWQQWIEYKYRPVRYIKAAQHTAKDGYAVFAVVSILTFYNINGILPDRRIGILPNNLWRTETFGMATWKLKELHKLKKENVGASC